MNKSKLVKITITYEALAYLLLSNTDDWPVDIIDNPHRRLLDVVVLTDKEYDLKYPTADKEGSEIAQLDIVNLRKVSELLEELDNDTELEVKTFDDSPSATATYSPRPKAPPHV